MSVRYNVTRKGMVFTPYLGTVVPSHAYPYYGHAAPGQRLREVQVGAFAAKLIASGPLAGLFVSGRAGYGFVEQVMDMSHNRTSGDFEVGYFLTPSLRAFGIVSGQYTHGGIDFPASGGMFSLPPEQRYVHDIIQQVHYVHAGGGVSYSISDSIDMFASFARQVSGRNGHAAEPGDHGGGELGLQPLETERQHCGQSRTQCRIRAPDGQERRLARPLHLPEVSVVGACRCGTTESRSSRFPAPHGT